MVYGPWYKSVPCHSCELFILFAEDYFLNHKFLSILKGLTNTKTRKHCYLWSKLCPSVIHTLKS